MKHVLFIVYGLMNNQELFSILKKRKIFWSSIWCWN